MPPHLLETSQICRECRTTFFQDRCFHGAECSLRWSACIHTDEVARHRPVRLSHMLCIILSNPLCEITKKWWSYAVVLVGWDRTGDSAECYTGWASGLVQFDASPSTNVGGECARLQPLY